MVRRDAGGGAGGLSIRPTRRCAAIRSTGGYVMLFYCVPDDYVGWVNVEIMPRVYDQGGDYAVSTLLATQWAGRRRRPRPGDGVR